MKAALVIFAAAALSAQKLPPQDAPPQDAPKDVLDFIRTATEALANQDAGNFLSHFDPKMPGYAKFSDDVQALLARSEVSSTIEIVSDRGDNQKQTLVLDWLLQIDENAPSRRIVKCALEKQGKKWKFVSFDPVNLFE
jgi:hypothetical protein